jgi:hypothetical protein
MNHVQELKCSINVACNFIGLTPGYFRRTVPLDAFLADTDFSGLTPQQIAVSALDFLCAGDGSSADQVVCHGVIDFLDEVLGVPPADKSLTVRMTDLWKTITKAGTKKQYEQWAAGWYK